MASGTADLPTFPAKRTDPFGIPQEYAALRKERPVTRVRLQDGGGEAWLVTGYREAREVLGSRRFSSDATKPGFPQSARLRQIEQRGVSVAQRLPSLALAVPLDRVAVRDDGFLHGVRELPVTW